MTLYWTRLRRRWVQELLAVAGIAVGVALIYASQVANSSMAGPVHQLNEALVGSSELQLVARGWDGFRERAARLESGRGPIARAAPVLEVPANLVGRRSEEPIWLVGADARTMQLRGGLLRTLMEGLTREDAARQRLLAVPAPIARAIGVRFGDNARVQIAGSARRVPVAVIGGADAGPLLHAAVVVAPLAYAQELAGLPGRVTRILVETKPGRLAEARALLERVARVNRLDVRSPDYEEQVFAAAAQPTSQSTAVAGAVCGLVGFLFAFCAMLVSANGRRALAGELRLDGFGQSRVARMMAGDALALAVAGIAAGLVGGEALSRAGFRADIGFLSGGFPIGDERIVTWQAPVIAAAAGVTAAFVGVLAPLKGVYEEREDSRRGRGRDERGRGGERDARAALGPASAVLAIGLAAAGAILTPGLAIEGLFALVVAATLLVPVALSGAARLFGAVSGRRRRAAAALELALANLRAGEGRARSVAIATTGAVAVVGAVSLNAAEVNLQAGLDRVTREVSAAADVWVAPRGPGDLFGTVALARERVRPRAFARVDGVREVVLYRSAMLDVDGQRVWVIGAAGGAPVPAAEIVSGDRKQAERRVGGGGWLTLPKRLADRLGLKVGDEFTLPSPAPTALRVAAITTNIGWPPGTVVMNGADFAHAWRTGAIGAYELQLARSVRAVRELPVVRRALGDRAGLFRVETAAQRDARQRAASRGGLARLRQVALLIQVAAILAMATAMAGLLWQRRVTVARLKLDGHGSGVLWRALAAECVVLFGTGCLVGAVLGLVGEVLLTRWVEAAQGFPAIVEARIGLAAGSLALVTGAAVAVVAVPGWLVARVAPSLRTGE